MENITSANFEQLVKQATVPVLLDFHANWCGPCRALKPTLQKIIEESKGEYKIYGVDIDVSPDLASMHQISGVPTMVIYKNGLSSQRFVGVHGKEKIVEALTS
jgi:thioredoxin 1